jgi:hypothetical protein
MAQADNVVHGRFRLDADDAGLVMASMREARLRTGKTREEFAQAINGRSGRPLALGAGSIEAYEVGFAQPVADVLLIALGLGGMDLRAVLTRWLYG